MDDLSIDFATQLALAVRVDLEVADARPPVVTMRPGSYGRDIRLVSVQVNHLAVRLNLSGEPEALRAWAEQVIRLADELAVEADDLADLVAAEGSTEVVF